MAQVSLANRCDSLYFHYRRCNCYRSRMPYCKCTSV